MNNKMVGMAVLDLVWTVVSYAALLAFIAIVGVIIFKFGITSFRLAINTVGATQGIENIRGVINRSDHRTTKEEDEIEIIFSYITSFIQTIIERNHHAKYTYDLLKVELIISYIKFLDNFVDQKITSRTDSFKNFVESKREKNFARYAYIQLFKK
ncbi:hypothetical protein [Methanobacterium sp.]|uniref:hypothetical protein n=1 Tax=Methanobacterium sp. TaxID=2164 RepID=UPI003C7393C9